MIWGLIGPKGGLEFSKLEGRMNSETYINDILQKHVIKNRNIK